MSISSIRILHPSILSSNGLQTFLTTPNLDLHSPDIDALRKTLVSLGHGGNGTHVLTYEELADRNSGARERVKEILKGRSIKLGLNAVCGRDTVNMMKLMG